MSQVTVWTCEENEEIGSKVQRKVTGTSLIYLVGDWHFCSHAI